MTIYILISTIDSGINQAKKILQKEQEGIKYIISHQYRDEQYKRIPEVLYRSDVIISQIPGAGLSRSRNHALQLAEGDIALIADDDVGILPDAFDIIRNVFSSDEAIDVACFKIRTPQGSPEYKDYFPYACKIDKKPPHYLSSIEIALRPKAVKAKNIKFDERFGLGGLRYPSGEEEVFIQDCIKAGLNVWYFPYYTVTHPFDSSTKSKNIFHPERNELLGALHARIYGWKAVPKACLDAFLLIPRLIAMRRNPIRYLYERLKGIFFIFATSFK